MNYTLNEKYSSIEDLLNKFPNGTLVDLGCGYYKPNGYIGIDDMRGENTQIVNQSNLPDIFMDLNSEVLPFEDNSVNEIRSSHFLEHSNMRHILRESYRVLKPDGIFTAIVPYANSAEGLYPGHTLFLTEKWFNENIYFKEHFKIMAEKYYPSSTYKSLPFFIRLLIPFKYARLFLFNACWQMELTCKVIK
ncbi:MAG: class I SAM-dependent methyltransferase [Desulfuromonadaceae bacterium]